MKPVEIRSHTIACRTMERDKNEKRQKYVRYELDEIKLVT